MVAAFEAANEMIFHADVVVVDLTICRSACEDVLVPRTSCDSAAVTGEPPELALSDPVPDLQLAEGSADS